MEEVRGGGSGRKASWLRPQPFPPSMTKPILNGEAGRFRRRALVNERLRSNVAVLDECSGARARRSMALKCFAMWDVFTIISVAGRRWLLRRLARRSPACPGMLRRRSPFAAGYSEADMELLETVDHVLFTSSRRASRAWSKPRRTRRPSNAASGSTLSTRGAVPMYDPCSNRLGVRAAEFGVSRPPGLPRTATSGLGAFGLHFHTLCEQGADALDETLRRLK